MTVNEYLRNIRLGPPPLATPITDDSSDNFGMPFHMRQNEAPAHGNIDPNWAAWFKGAGQRLVDLPGPSDTHANRKNYLADRYLGMFFYETDRKIFYISTLVSSIPAWVFAFGLWSGTQATLPADLSTNDAGFEAEVTDYAHRLRWSGSAWGWAPGDGGSGFMALFEVDPTGNGWKLYNGATVNYLKADGTTGSVTLPDLAGTAAYPKAGTPNSGPNAATAPTVGGSLAVANNSTGITASMGGPTAGNVLVTTAGVTAVASGSHIHTITIGDPTHGHSLSGSITVGADGEPRNIVRRPWFRQ